MRKRRQLLAYSLLALMGVVVVAFMAASMITEQQRREAVANIKKPQAIVRFEQRQAARTAAQDAGPASSSATSDSSPDTFAVDEDETLEAWAVFFGELEEAWEHEGPWTSLSFHGRGLFWRPAEAWSAEERAAIEAFVKANPELLDAIVEMVERGGPVARIDLSNILSVDHTSAWHVRDCALLLYVDALMRARQGDADGASQSIMTGMALAELLQDDPTFRGVSWRLDIHERMIDALQQTFDWGGIPPETISRARRYIAGATRRAVLTESLAVEQYFYLGLFEDMRGMNPAELQDRYGIAGYALWAYGSPMIARPFFNSDEAAFARISSQIIEASRLPYYEMRSTLEALHDTARDASRTHPISNRMIPLFLELTDGWVQYEAESHLAGVALLLEQHYYDHGVYPETLDAIAPLSPLPVDPYTGEPYHYEPNGHTFTLYSVGANLVWRGGNKHHPASEPRRETDTRALARRKN